MPGYLSKRKKEHFFRYDLVLADFGGDTDKARKEYRKTLIEEMTRGIGIQDQIIGQAVIGGEEFISWIKEKFLSEEKDGIIQAIVRQSGKTFETRKTEKGTLRQITMDLPYRQAGMTNLDIGRLFGVDYSAVSQERRRLRMLVEKDRKVSRWLCNFEAKIYQGSRNDP